MKRFALLVAVALVGSMPTALAESAGGAATINEGAHDVMVGQRPVARSGDSVGQKDKVVGGSSNVFIGGKPAVRAGDQTECGGIVVGGSSNVFVNGKPLATAGTRRRGVRVRAEAFVLSEGADL